MSSCVSAIICFTTAPLLMEPNWAGAPWGLTVLTIFLLLSAIVAALAQQTLP